MAEAGSATVRVRAYPGRHVIVLAIVGLVLAAAVGITSGTMLTGTGRLLGIVGGVGWLTAAVVMLRVGVAFPRLSRARQAWATRSALIVGLLPLSLLLLVVALFSQNFPIGFGLGRAREESPRT